MINDDDTLPLTSEFMLTARITLVGMLAVLGLVIGSFTFPEEASSLDRAKSLADFAAAVEAHTTEALIILALDSIFIAGYLALFVGLYLIIRDYSDNLSRLPLALGLLTGLGDIIENALLFAMLQGIPDGWSPDPSLYGFLWGMGNFIDICSYVSAVMFAMIFLSLFRPPSLKFWVGLLLLGYAVVGYAGLVEPSFLLIRSLLFIVGLGVGSYAISRERNISLAQLQQLLDSERTDYIQ